MSVAVKRQPAADVPSPWLRLYRFTVDQRHRIVEAGGLDETQRVELLEGWIVVKSTYNPPHCVAICLVGEQVRKGLPDNWRVRIRSAVTTSDSEPEPDVAVVRGKALDAGLWRDLRLDYFALTADAVLGVPPSALENEHAWGLMAARGCSCAAPPRRRRPDPQGPAPSD